jgi:outer membrane protein insertion porin family
LKTSPFSPINRAFALVFILIAAVSGLIAQEAPQAPPQKIGTITIKFVGVANVSEQVVRANMALREGNDFDDSIVDRDIRSLYKTGLFEFIEVKRENGPNNTVNLVVEATPKYRILSIRFDGIKAYKPHRLQREIKTTRNGTLDERQVKEDAEKLTEFYQKNGYNQVQVTYTVDRNRSTGFGTVVFRIREGNRVRISSIKFIGNDHIKAKRLLHQMETSKWQMFSWLTGGGRLKNDDFDDDLNKLRDFYKDQGYLDVEIAEDKVTFDYPSPGKLNIIIRVNEGRLYHIGDITITGNKLYPENALRFALRQKTGMVFRPSKLDKDVEGLSDIYGRDGHLETRVRLIRKPNLQTGNIDLEYKIEEGDKFQVETIKIEGNSKTKSTVILRELILGPGDAFDSVRMKISKARLENTRFFDDVNVTDESTNIPGRRNMKVAVKEARTGNLTFGAGYSSLERATVFAELTQSNFDLFNRKSFWQGAGEKFKLRLQIGSVSNEIVLAFEEPWFLERELALGFQLFRTLSDYNSADYQEVRLGGQVYVRKRLFGLIEGTLTYTYEVVDIDNVNPESDLTILELAGKTKVSKLGLSLVRDTRNKIINTTRGGRLVFNTEVAGGPLLGDVNYYQMELRGSNFFPIFKPQNQVLSLIGRAGVVESFGKSNEVVSKLVGYDTNGLPVIVTGAPGVPFFDRFFLGGPDDLRGFEYRDVGPKDPTSGEPLGGKTYAFFNAEYSVDIVKPIRFAVFYDVGYVNANAYDFNPKNFNDDFGFGIRLMVAGAPLSLDYGIPLTSDHFNRKGNQFNFSFGTRF